jgi:NAD-dependent dihydropyrimidine dehydrogenase PreA subunit
MIELVSSERCTRCNLCVRVCPMDVFDLVPGAPPAIARQDTCQTCFLCEAHCPDDALYVAPLREPAPPGSPHLDLEALTAAGVLGGYRARLGWGPGRTPPRTTQDAYALAGLPAPSPTNPPTE